MMYQFKCSMCDNVQVIKCTVSDRPDIIKCNKCSDDMYRDFTGEACTFQLKGTCWEKDGYK